ncbi:MAG: sulfotransferase [Pseudomonadota bacterium]|nr:sulfotransferase [Pseudomonadota bacterium]
MVSHDPATAAERVQSFIRAGTWGAALGALDEQAALQPGNAQLQVQRARCLLALRRRQEALGAVDAAERCAPHDPYLLDAAATLRSFANDHRGALAAYDRAVALAPHVARLRYNRAAVRRFVGDLEGAEADYDCAIALRPLDYEAYFNRSELRIQTAARNHVSELEALSARPFADWRGEVQIRYALATEYEDLGDYKKSFAHLKRGADTRRKHMQYDVALDVATVDWIIEAFPRGPGRSEETGGAPGPGEAPIFIVGLPRSGTTLVERILDGHPRISAAGELDAFALALVDQVRRGAGRAVPRRELISLSATLDFAALGRDYIRRVRDLHGEGRFIDKMPLNYLYCGLILRALPGAKIIHMTRHPMAAGYAIYKTLFKDGYPFSYDLADIARYYVGYRRLMDHWRTTMPGALYDLSYERLVSDRFGETRKLLEFCGLDWQDSCANFERNPSASTTASAAQVRRPMYDSSVVQWRHYSAELAPLSEALTQAGIEL